MKLHTDPPTSNFTIRAYDVGRIVVNEETFTRSLIVTPQRLHPNWTPQRFEDLAPEHFQVIVEYDPEIVLVGTGERLRFPAPHLTAAVLERGIGLEIMDSNAACRTYNILMAEGRNVAAALLIVGA